MPAIVEHVDSTAYLDVYEVRCADPSGCGCGHTVGRISKKRGEPAPRVEDYGSCCCTDACAPFGPSPPEEP